MLHPRHDKPQSAPPTARAAWCAIGTTALGLTLAACTELDAAGADPRQSIGERRALDGEYYQGADPNFQRGSKGGGG